MMFRNFGLCACVLGAQMLSASGVPGEPKTPANETFRYSVNWPSGLSLGEATLTASTVDGKPKLAFHIEASVPGFPLSESAESVLDGKGCSAKLEKKGTRGTRKVGETTEFDQAKLTATRITSSGGGKSELSIPPCARDALAYLFFLRKELAGGRIPHAQKVYYGSGYEVRVEYSGLERVRVGDEFIESDRLSAKIKGPASEFKVELLFAKDAKRTPVAFRIELPMGKFRVELVR